MKTSQLLPTT